MMAMCRFVLLFGVLPFCFAGDPRVELVSLNLRDWNQSVGHRNLSIQVTRIDPNDSTSGYRYEVSLQNEGWSLTRTISRSHAQITELTASLYEAGLVDLPPINYFRAGGAVARELKVTILIDGKQHELFLEDYDGFSAYDFGAELPDWKSWVN